MQHACNGPPPKKKLIKPSEFLYAVFGIAITVSLTVMTVRGYLQLPSGNTSFTQYSGCGSPACGVTATGFTAAINQLAFGSVPGLGAGDACGRCFALTGAADPYSPAFTGPFNSIIVKVTDMCPVEGNEQWCGQTTSDPINSFGTEFHFDICEDTGGASAFFPSGHTALTGSFVEVSCSEWSGSDGSDLWNGACISGESAALWPGGLGVGIKERRFESFKKTRSDSSSESSWIWAAWDY
ncbi:endoglucanase V-like protein [Lentinula edodes]|uniref:Endoglucanase V-like protein n=1 Tax=Lentinula lateritia TaxID=40482 RepID=A0A9W9AX38_9AGAR|nr:endoglucanase V-like protein [Lentinula edodes]